PVAGACWRCGKYDPRADRTRTEPFGLVATRGAGTQSFTAVKRATETPSLRHSAIRAGSEEPCHWPQYGRAHRRYGKDLEYRPSRTRRVGTTKSPECRSSAGSGVFFRPHRSA